jgi:thymidylate synthase (FAD)
MQVVTDGTWEPEVPYDAGSALAEFAGRACYQSWSRPNPVTATNAGYLDHVLDVEHFSVVEHGSVSFYVEGVSRSLTHELVRHRHMSFSQLSQRYVQAADQNPVIPPLYRDSDDEYTAAVVMAAWKAAINSYDMLVAEWMPRLIEQHGDVTKARKKAREAARCVLPNMTPTSLVVTANHRTWREFIAKRATVHADAEICEFAVAVYDQLNQLEGNLYQDMKVTEVDGRMVVVVRGV